MTKAFSVLSLPVALLSASCGGDDDNNKNNNTGTTSQSLSCTANVCTVPAGEFTTDMTWTADNTYLLKGKVFIGKGTPETAAVLTIEAGTKILGESASKAYLAILPYSKIMARGTAQKPIIFTSDAATRGRGDWGGLILSGNAPVNCGGSATTCQGEGDTGAYGGTDAADNSGVLEYVRVEFAGNQVNPTDELNGIAFQGVGSGTTVNHVQVHKAKDDGIEFFGGTVNVDHVLITGVGDDCFDWTYGWQGTARYVIAQQYDDDSDNGIEADNNGDAHDASPRSNPTIENITFIGSPDSDKSDIGLLLRAGTAGKISKAIVAYFNDACVDIDDAATFTLAGGADGTPTNSLTVKDSIFWCPTPGKAVKDNDEDPWKVSDFMMGLGNSEIDPQIAKPFDLSAPDFSASASEAAGKGGMPDGDWYTGWAAFPAS